MLAWRCGVLIQSIDSSSHWERPSTHPRRNKMQVAGKKSPSVHQFQGRFSRAPYLYPANHCVLVVARSGKLYTHPRRSKTQGAGEKITLSTLYRRAIFLCTLYPASHCGLACTRKGRLHIPGETRYKMQGKSRLPYTTFKSAFPMHLVYRQLLYSLACTGRDRLHIPGRARHKLDGTLH